MLLAVLLLAATPTQALAPATPLASLNRQSWVMENGLPQNSIQAIAQTTDGFLWLGTEVGLVRFDGAQFAVLDRNSKPALPGNDVRALLATSDGALWIGTGDGLAKLDHGAVAVFTTANGLPDNSVQRLSIDNTGGVLVETETGAVGISGNRALPVVMNMLTSPGESKLDVPLANGERALIGKTSVTFDRNGHQVSEFTVGKQLPGTVIQAHLADREGALWIGTNRGLARIVNGKIDKLPVTDPLATASILNLLEDREGNVWVGTETSGLHVLRDQRFSYVGAHEGLTSDNITALAADAAGRLWVGTNGAGLNAIRLSGTQPGQPAIYSLHFGLLSKTILSLAAGTHDELWVGTPAGLNRVRGSAIDAFTTVEGLPDNTIRALRVDRDGSLWIGTRRGLAHWTFDEDGREITARRDYNRSSGLGSNIINALARDARGDLWIATASGLSRIHAGKVSTFTISDGLSSNSITTLIPRPDGLLFIGTQDRGWNLWNGSVFKQLGNAEPSGGPQSTGIHAALDDGLGHLWFTIPGGIARCDAVPANPAQPFSACSTWVEFGPAEGLRGRLTATLGQPPAWRSPAGRLWFATPRGILTLTPANFPFNTVPPPVVIERFAVDDFDQAFHAAGAPMTIESEHVHFQFDYAALSFTAPQNVRYRYMLEGFDKNWTEAGTRRTAYYTSIPPGRYTFRVQAANNDGVWNTTGASVAFELRPHYYQTPWFYIALVVALILLAILVIRYRLSRAEKTFQAVLAERGRIAREIHDTLAQGYVGVSVQLEVLSELLRRNRLTDAEKHLDATRESVRAGLADARQSIWALRSQEAGETALPIRLRRMTERAASGKLDARFSIHGANRPLSSATEQELLRIAQEAIQNAVRHSGARHLWVQLNYRPEQVQLEIRDDGHGFEPAARIESPAGHYGLTGMRERADSLGATLTLTSHMGEGTSVHVELPAPAEDAAGKTAEKGAGEP